MREIINIAINQLRVQLSGRGAIITLFVIPVAMTLFLGFALNDSGAPTGRVVDILRSPDTTDDLAGQFVSLWQAEGKKQVNGKDRYIICDLAPSGAQPAECKLSAPGAGTDLTALAKQRVENGVSFASLTLPAGFSADLRAGKSVTVKFDTKASLASSQSFQQDLGAVNQRLAGALIAARSVTESTKGDTALYNRVYTEAQAIWAQDPVLVEQSYSTVTGTSEGSGFGQSAPGIGAMFVLMNALTLAEVFIQERKHWTMQRMQMLPLSRAQILGGKLLGQYLLGLLTFAIIIVLGSAVGLKWGDPVALVLIVVTYTLAVTALGLAISTLVRTGGQAAGVRLLAALILSPLGGAWWPSSITPPAMQIIGKIVSPVAWSQDAFGKMIFYGASWTDILPSVGVLLVFAVVFFVFGISRYKYE